MKMFLFMIMMIISIWMYTLSNPMSMGFLILIQTILTSIISGMILNSYWFSYILFLTFLGGLLVLFIYISSIASNEFFFYSNLNLFNFFILMFIIYIYCFLHYKNFYLFFSNEEMNNFFNNYFFFNNENKINLSKLYNKSNFLLMIMMIIYLFITLLATVKIMDIFYGPIRSNFN